MRNNGQKDYHILAQQLQFTPEGEKYLKEALTHPTYWEGAKENTNHNQRLEFFGDAILGLVMAEYLFLHFPKRQEGELTRMRASLVCEGSLAKAAQAIALGDYLFLGKGCENNGDRQRPSILADAFEAVIGAIYLDRGLEGARSFILQALLGEEPDWSKINQEDNKSHLQSFVQQFGEDPLEYRVEKEWGPDHEKLFLVAVCYKGKKLAEGEGSSKKEAEQQAAGIAYKNRKQWKNLLKVEMDAESLS